MSDDMGAITKAISDAIKQVLADRKMVFVSVFHDVERNLFTIATNYNDRETIRAILQEALTRVENQIKGEVRH